MLENKKILVLGMARSGYHVAKLLASKNEIIVTDRNEQNKDLIKELNELGIDFIQSENGEELVNENIDVLIKNPGISQNHIKS